MQKSNSGNAHLFSCSADLAFATVRNSLIKWMGTLSSVAIVSCLNVSPSLAMIRASEQAANPIPSSQTEPILMAGLFDDLLEAVEDATEIVDTVTETVDTVTTFIDEQDRRQQYEEAMRAANERDRLEAEARQRYFESLSPEQQQAYIAQQEELQAQQDQASALFLMGLAALMFGGSSSQSAGEGSPNDLCYVYNSDGSPAYSTTRSELSNFDGVECRPQ